MTTSVEVNVDLLIAAFVACALVMVGMAVGVMFGNRRIKGTCGGLGAMSDDFGQPMCECGARDGEFCGNSVVEADSAMARDARPVFDPLSTAPPPVARQTEEVGVD